MTNLLNGRLVLHGGDNRVAMRCIESNTVDSFVTDPPYALESVVKRFGGDNAAPTRDGDVYARSSGGFMGQKWDTGEVAFDPEFWRECYRVLKPGGFLVAFGGTRTYHKLASAIEAAGFDIRDMIQWLYGTGFPKSHSVSKGIDRTLGAAREVIGTRRAGVKPNGGLCEGGLDEADKMLPVTAPATPEAAYWDGWGTALKPANEPICLARKPLSEKTVAANVLKWGTGAINIDACRVGTEGATKRSHQESYGDGGRGDQGGEQNWRTGHDIVKLNQGRWPANVIHDGSDEVVSAFPNAGGGMGVRGRHLNGTSFGADGSLARADHIGKVVGYGDGNGSASRFFYSAKASKRDRAGSKHPTVKPINPLRWLCRLVTPPGGTVLDPFAGTGTTGEAALLEGFKAILIEREPEYLADIFNRFATYAAEDTERELVAANDNDQIDLEDAIDATIAVNTSQLPDGMTAGEVIGKAIDAIYGAAA